MALQQVCDRCGAVINPKNSATRIVYNDGPYVNTDGRKNYDLCVSCAYYLKNWLRMKERSSSNG